MLSRNLKALLLFSVLILLMIMPISFAHNSDALVLNESSSDTDALISVSLNQTEVLTSPNHYYFDASSENDGNGSLENPFKYLTDARIYDGSVIHLARGEYTLSPSKTHSNVSIYGEDSIIKGNGKSLTVTTYFALNNLTIVNIPITNKANFMASDVIFANSTAKSDSYGNSYGGAIYCINNDASIYLDNCIFENTFAEYGGAVYAVGCVLNIRNSSFYNCVSNNFGGAISCKNTKNATISRSKFDKCHSINDAGGAISIVLSTLNATAVEFKNCNAVIGGAMTSLNSVVYLEGITCFNNSAINGGALYHMYGNFTVQNSIFTNNSAINGGALFIDNSESLFVKNNDFINNTASYCAGAIFSLLNELEPFENNYSGNSALIMDDEYVSSQISLNVGSGNYTMFKVNFTPVDELPSRYSAIDEKYVTSVKNQQSGGNCWAFATLAVLESCILKASNVTYDLSEENMKNLMALYSDYGWSFNTNEGGHDWMSWGYLTSWLGPVNESDDKTDDLSLVSPVFNSVAHIQNVLFLSRDNYTDNDAIKQAILNYGAVGTSMAMYGGYLKNNAYYCYSNDNINHAVAIVGWDDNYSKSNFKKEPEGDGAWIVKNSWGTSWGDKGYFYVSYYDKGFAQPQVSDVAYTFILNDTIRYDRNYQYDISGRTDYFLNASSTVWYKNVFTSVGDEFLAGVSTYFEKITNWTVTVNVNNQFAYSKSGTCNPGYYTIDLDNLIPLKTGDVFEVIFNINVDGGAGFPISEIYSLNNLAYSSNVSYASWNGIDWVDLFDFEFAYSTHWYASQVACIKAFTIKDIINTTLSLYVSEDLDVVVKVFDQYGNLLKKGNVTFDVNGIIYELEIADGVAALANSVLNQTNNVITVIFSKMGYNSSTNATVVEIPKTNVDLSLNISKYLNNAVISLESSNNINATLNVKINNRFYPVVLSKGKGYLNLTGLENDVYAVEVKCDELSLYQFDDLSGLFVIDAKRTRIISGDLITFEESGVLFNVTLVDEDGAVLAGKELVLVLNNSTVIKKTDSQGMLSIPLNLTNGYYLVDIDFNGDEDYFKSNQTNGIKVKMNVDIAVNVNRSVNNISANVNLSKEINETLTVIVNDKSYSIDSTDGMALLELSDLSNGLYNISVMLDNSDDYHFMNANSTFVIDVKNTGIISNDLITSENSGDSFNITLVDEKGDVLAGKELSIIFNNSNFTKITDDYGRFSIPVNLTYGVYPIEINFNGDDNYFKSSQTNRIKVKMNVDIDVAVNRTLNDVDVNVMLSKLINESLTVIVNDKAYSINSTNVNAMLKLSNLSNGVYILSVFLDDLDNYNSARVDSSFVIDVKNTQIQSGDIIMTDDDYINFNATLTDENGIALANKNLTFALENSTFNQVTDADGMAFIPINLAMGEYEIVMIFSGDNDHFASSASNVIKVKSKVEIAVSVDSYQKNAVVNISISKSINESLTVKVNDKTFNVNVNEGKAVLELDNLSNGVYEVNVDLDDTDHYDFTYVNVNFTIDVKATRIQSDNLIITEDDYANFNVSLTDENGVPLADKNITFVLGDATYCRTTDIDGVAVIPLDLTMGEYDVVITFTGDNNHLASSAANLIKVKRNVSIDLFIGKSSNNALINITLSKSVNETLTVIVNDKHYKIRSINGNALLKQSNLKNGKYDVNVRLDNDNYVSQELNYEFIINVKQNNAAPGDVAVVNDEKNHFNLTITDENNDILPNCNVSIVLDNIKYDVITDENGQVSLPLDLALGEHAIDIYIKEANKYKSIKSDTIAIKSKVDIDCEIANFTDKTVINVNLSKKINGTLEITVDKESYRFPITDKTMSVEVPDLDASLHNVEIRLLEGNIYQFEKISAQVKGSVKKTRILADNLITYYKSGEIYTVTLSDENGKLLSDKEIQFRFSNGLFIATTNELGQASINVILINGKYDVSVTFKGDGNYYGSSNLSAISVKSTIIVNDSLTKTFNSKYSFKLLDLDGNPLKNTKVSYTLDNVDYYGVSDAEGIVSVPITKQYGNCLLTVYNPVNYESISKTITVLNRITENNDITIYAYSGSYYKVLVLDDDGNPETAGKIVTFKINNKEYSSRTDNNGYASLKISLAAKQYTITATYNGFKVSNKVKVKPVLTAKNVSKKKATYYKFSAKLVNSKGKAIKGKKITFKIKGKKFTAKTNKNGVATVTMKLSLKVGSYKIYSIYGKSKISNIFKIRR